MRRGLFRIISWLLIITMACPLLLAQAAQAVISSTGNVTVDGKAANQGGAVFAGQVIQTSGGSSAFLNFQGSLVSLSPNTSASLGTGELVLGCGDVVVTSTRGFGVKAGDLIVAPSPGESAKFEVTQTPSGVRLAAQQGTLRLSNGKTLQPGETDTEPGGGTCAATSGSNRNAAPIPAAGVNKGGPILLGALAAGGAAAIVILTTRGKASPRDPND